MTLIRTKSTKGLNKDIRKVRQHVNPLAAAYQRPVQLPENWIEEWYENPKLPFHVDIGCAKGLFPLQMAQHDPGRNFLGLEIRKALVEHANEEYVKGKGVPNLRYLQCNANVDLAALLRDINAVSHVARVSIQFPDPHFKKKHHKRRVMKPGLAKTIGKFLDPQGELFMQGDIFEVMAEMREVARAEPRLYDTAAPSHWREGPESNPLPVPTERELYVYRKGGDVYRMVFKKKPDFVEPGDEEEDKEQKGPIFCW